VIGTFPERKILPWRGRTGFYPVLKKELLLVVSEGGSLVHTLL
jgi:hypothetical protein